MKRGAIISECGKYRYLLSREWDATLPRFLFIMLNPSTADAEKDDATIRSCIRLSKALHRGGFEVVNLFAWRATKPKELLKAGDPIGPNNDQTIVEALERCTVSVGAWGAMPFAAKRGYQMKTIIRKHQPEIYCLGTTKSGAPRHPLYVHTDTQLEVLV